MRFTIAFSLLTLLTGCGSRVPDTTAGGLSGVDLYQEAQAAADAGDCATAIEKVTAAFAQNINPDFAEKAYVLRAKCRAESGDYDGALTDLDHALEGTVEPGDLYATRGDIYLKMGNKERAGIEYSQA